MRWKTWRQTEPRGYPIPHRVIVLYPFTMAELKSFWAEVFSWNPDGHFPKITAGRFLWKGSEHYAANVLYSGTSFRRQLVRAAKAVAKNRIKWFAGRFRMQFAMNDEFVGKMPAFPPSWQGMKRSSWKTKTVEVRKKQKSVAYPPVGSSVDFKRFDVQKFFDDYLTKDEAR